MFFFVNVNLCDQENKLNYCANVRSAFFIRGIQRNLTGADIIGTCCAKGRCKMQQRQNHSARVFNIVVIIMDTVNNQRNITNRTEIC